MLKEAVVSIHFKNFNDIDLLSHLIMDCDKALLRDLVLKLKPVLFLPGDYVCKKGEVGKEMYIVSKGMVQVVGGPKGDQIFATLKEGSVFGEISLLALAGGNRRTADVRSKGFSNLFVLSKDDLNESIADYPDAQRILKRKAKKLIKNDAEKKQSKRPDSEELEKISSVSTHVPTPKILETVVQVLDPHTHVAETLKAALDHEHHDSSIERRDSAAEREYP